MKAKILILAFALLGFVVGCAATATPAPTPAPTQVPTQAPKPTDVPTRTPLPPTPTLAPTDTPVPATNTPLPTTPAPTATNTRRPVTAKPTATVQATPTAIALKYNAPELLDPKNGDSRVLKRDAFIFRWQPVADLAPDECYALRLRIINLADPNKNYGEQTYLVQSTCNWAVGSGIPEFVVSGRAPAPNYDGLVAEADGKAGGVSSQEYQVQWAVQVVLNDTKLTPLSPPSAIGEFRLVNP